MASNQINYISNYNKKNYKMYQFRVKKNDIELINILESVTNRNNYIINLIKSNNKSSVLTIKQIKERIKPLIQRHGINDVYLFGSYARGEATSSSDIDIYCDKGDVDTLFKVTAFIDELEEVLGKKVDIVTIGSNMNDYFKKQLEEDMIKIC